jgi:hypothetical protein
MLLTFSTVSECKIRYNWLPGINLGASRPGVLSNSRTGPRRNVSRRQCHGQIKDCTAIFNRMREVTLVIQPGKSSITADYIARLNRLLQATEQGREWPTIRIRLNFQNSQYRYLYPTLSPKAGEYIKHASAITSALRPFATSRRPGQTVQFLSCKRMPWSDPVNHILSEFVAEDGAERVSMNYWIQARSNEYETPCFSRGSFGNQRGSNR